MKAWQVSEWCEPEQMKLADIPVPEPKSGEVRIEILARLSLFRQLRFREV